MVSAAIFPASLAASFTRDLRSCVNMGSAQHLQALQDLARAPGVEISIHRIAKPDEIAAAIDAAKASSAQALNVLAEIDS